MFIRQIYNKALLHYTHNKNLFSKIRKRAPRQPTQKQNEEVQFNLDEYINYNYEHFDCLASLKKIHNAYTRTLQYDKLLQAKQLYDKMDEYCTQLLREQNQKLIIKISQGQICYEDLKKVLNLKVFMQLRFRKWDDMVLDLHNYIQALKYEHQDQIIAEKMAVQSYHKLCAIFIMNNHDQLYELFDYELKLTPERKRKIKDTSDKIRPFGFGFDTYHKLQIEAMNISNPNIQNSEILLLQGMGLLVLGRKEVGLRKLSILTGLNFSNEIRQQAFISIITSLSFPSKGSKPITQKQIENIKKARTITLFDAKQLAESHITVLQSEQILKELMLAFYKKDITQLSSTVLKKYFNILALICQNYYIEGKENEYNRLSTLLKSKGDKHLSFMLSYFEIARYVDKNDLENAENLFKETKALDEQLIDGIREFYSPEKIIFDLLRVNIYKLGCRIYELKGDKQLFKQYLQQAELLQCKLGVYTIRQPNEQIIQGNQLTVDWRNTVSGRVPYHYLNLRLQKILGMNEDIFEQTSF